MIDIIGGCLFMESDIRKIRYGEINSAGRTKYGITVFLQGDERPVSEVYESELEMSSALSQIRRAWADSRQEQRHPSLADEFRIMQERMDETERQLDAWRTAQQSTAAGSRQKKKAAKKKGTAAPKEPAHFIPPTDEELIAYIKEKKIDQKLATPAETIAESFRSVYESDEPTGEKDSSGSAIFKWKKANGDPVENWKLCMNTFKGRQLMWNGERSAGAGKKPGKNQFTQGVQNNEYDFDQLEKDLTERNGSVAI